MKNLLLTISIKLIRVLRTAAPRKRVYALIPASRGSLGDQAMLAGLSALLPVSEGWCLRQVVFTDWQALQVSGSEADPLIIKGSNAQAQSGFVMSLMGCGHFGVIGADIIDGVYSAEHAATVVQLCNLAVRCGIPTTIFGFSFSLTPHPEAIAALRRLDNRVTCLCRDEVSLQRFLSATGKAARLVADLAFHLRPELVSAGTAAALRWYEAARPKGMRILVFNINHLTTGGAAIDLVKVSVDELTEILVRHRDVHCLLLAHDFRGHQSDQFLLSQVYAQLPEDLRDRVFLLEPPFTAADVKEIVGLGDLVVTGRMHLAIATLGQGIPALGVAYQGKFEGLFDYFSVRDLLFDPSGLTRRHALADHTSRILGDLARYRELIATNLPHVIEQSGRNVSHIRA
jgi:polysaccharide pyruvyl transferase WcaK-like protein